VTRGKRLVVLVGQQKAVAIAVRMCRGGDAGRVVGNTHCPLYYKGILYEMHCCESELGGFSKNLLIISF
jgi:hypothetical protein